MIIYKGLGVPDRNQAHRNMGFSMIYPYLEVCILT